MYFNRESASSRGMAGSLADSRRGRRRQRAQPHASQPVPVGACSSSRRKTGWERKIPQPGGPQEIVYGDKVINFGTRGASTTTRRSTSASSTSQTARSAWSSGPFACRGRKRAAVNRLNVEFSTQPGVAYDYWLNELGGDDQPRRSSSRTPLTIHKSQGSEFGETFVVIPNPCRLLSRELLYTALTRHRERIVLLHQGDLHDLRRLGVRHSRRRRRASRTSSSTPKPVEIDGSSSKRASSIRRARASLCARSRR